ncbi:MAG TPA: beta-ketoacyl synthase N-terminal-like domain-containing protein, partial [Methylocystis sp.]
MAFSRARAGERRVVISGMGAVCASGVGARKLWEAARDGLAQIRPLRTERPYDGRIKIAAQVPDFNPADYIEPEVLPFCDPFTQFCIVAADEAMAQAGFARKDIAGPRTAVIIGTGIGGMTTIEDGIYRYYVEGTRPEMLSVPKLIP